MLKQTANPKKVLLFSGGLDSFLMAHLLKVDVLLNISYDGVYSNEEQARIELMREKGMLPEGVQLRFADMRFLRHHERLEDLVIPMRNLYFVTEAAHYGDTIYLGAMKGDTNLLDKSPAFLEMTSRLLTYLHAPQRWCEGRIIKVEAPFIETSKEELIRMFLQADLPYSLKQKEEMLRTSFSCHSPVRDWAKTGPEPALMPCGGCKPCLRKCIALELNGVSTQGMFAKDPLTSDLAQMILDGDYRTISISPAQIRAATLARGARA